MDGAVRRFALTSIAAVALVLVTAPLWAKVTIEKINDENTAIYVSGSAWEPDGFEKGVILEAGYTRTAPRIDGDPSDPAWSKATPLRVPLRFGRITSAELKALHSDQDAFLLVSWTDPTKDDLYRPWVWSASEGRHVAGTRVDDGLLLSFEMGCQWAPSLLSGGVFDFDGWLWLAGRTDPLGQAVDTSGHVQDRFIPDGGYREYRTRGQKVLWRMKFLEHGQGLFTRPWHALDRAYLRQPAAEKVYVSFEPDGARPVAFTKQLSLDEASRSANGRPARPPRLPRFVPVPLTGDAGEVAARGTWNAGRWTVEFRRKLVTPARILSDVVFDKPAQFSVYVFDATDRVDRASESGRIYLHFVK